MRNMATCVELRRPATNSKVQVKIDQDLQQYINSLVGLLESIAIEKPTLKPEEAEAADRIHSEVMKEIVQRLYDFALPLEGNGWLASGIVFPELEQ